MSFDRLTGLYTGVVYCITNKINGKQYIGITTRSLEKRWNEHVHINSGSVIHCAIEKYGEHSFDIEVISEFSKPSLDELFDTLYGVEIACINQHNSIVPNGYNKSTGGEGSKGNTWVMSEEQKELFRKIHKGMKCSEDTKRKISKARTGFVTSEETKQKLREKSTGRIQTKEAKEKIRNWHKGKKKPYVSKHNKARLSKPVAQFDINGDLVERFDSAKDAQRATGMYQSAISRCCNGEMESYRGYIWIYDDGYTTKIHVSDVLHDTILNNTKYRRVIQYSLDLQKIAIYNSARDAAKQNNCSSSGIYKCCNGVFHQLKGYIWKYENPEYQGRCA